MEVLLAADEQFDVDEEELERTLSLGTAEKLRDAGLPAMQSLLDAQDNYVSPRMLCHNSLPPRSNLAIHSNEELAISKVKKILRSQCHVLSARPVWMSKVICCD